jgi:hypothetical protein
MELEYAVMCESRPWPGFGAPIVIFYDPEAAQRYAEARRAAGDTVTMLPASPRRPPRPRRPRDLRPVIGTAYICAHDKAR